MGRLKRLAKYCNMRYCIIGVKVGDMVLLETHFLISRAHKKVAKLGPKFASPYEFVKLIENNLLDVVGNLLRLIWIRCVYTKRPFLLLLLLGVRIRL